MVVGCRRRELLPRTCFPGGRTRRPPALCPLSLGTGFRSCSCWLNSTACLARGRPSRCGAAAAASSGSASSRPRSFRPACTDVAARLRRLAVPIPGPGVADRWRSRCPSSLGWAGSDAVARHNRPADVVGLGLSLAMFGASFVMVHAHTARFADALSIPAAALFGISVVALVRQGGCRRSDPRRRVGAAVSPARWSRSERGFSEIPWYAFLLAALPPITIGLLAIPPLSLTGFGRVPVLGPLPGSDDRGGHPRGSGGDAAGGRTVVSSCRSTSRPRPSSTSTTPWSGWSRRGRSRG